MVELFGKDRAIGEQSETASEMRQRWATSTKEGSMENIEDIDHYLLKMKLLWRAMIMWVKSPQKPKREKHQKMRTLKKLWGQFRMLL